MLVYRMKESENEIIARLKILMIIRVVVVTLILIIAVIVNYKEVLTFSFLPFNSIVIITYIFSILYAVLLRRIKNYTHFAKFQIVMDLFLATLLIYTSGGTISLFNFIYIFSIIASSIVISARSGLWAASLGAILYGIIIDLEYYQIIPPMDTFRMQRIISVEPHYIFILITTNILAFFTVAGLSGYLVERLKKTSIELEEKKINLIDLQSFNRDVLQNMVSGLITLDIDGIITSSNRAAEEITGYTFGEIQEKPWEYIFGNELKFNEVANPSINENMLRRKRYELNTHRKDKTKICIGLSVSHLRSGDGKSLGYICIFQDLTHVKLMENRIRSADRLAAIGRLSASVAHEIRNPLASISGCVEVLSKELSMEGTNRELMDIIIKETERLNKIIGEFLGYARPKPPNKEFINIVDVLNDVIDLLLLRKDIPENIEIRKDYDSCDLRLYVDPQQIRQVFWNICLNAIEAMPSGGELRINVREARQGYLNILFSDSGIGISNDSLTHIFEPFYSTKEKGTGMGLAYVHRVIEDHGGFIEVESYEGKGTTFRVSLPILSSQENLK